MPRLLLLAISLISLSAQADLRLLLDEQTLAAVAAEVSGEEAKRNLDFITFRSPVRRSD